MSRVTICSLDIYQTTWTAPWEICMQAKKQQLKLDMEQQTGSKSGKVYVKALYCHPAYLTCMQSSVQLLSCVWLFATPWTANTRFHHQLPKLTQTHVHWVSDVIQPSHPLSSPSPPAFNPSQHQGLFKWVSSLHHMVKVLELQLHHLSNEYSELISFRIDWLDILAVQGTFKSLL